MNLENWKQDLWYFFHSLISQLLHPASQLITEKSNTQQTHAYGQFKVPSLPHMYDSFLCVFLWSWEEARRLILQLFNSEMNKLSSKNAFLNSNSLHGMPKSFTTTDI